jgi:hypothetical protein
VIRATLRITDVSLWVAIASLLIGLGGLAVAILGYRSNRKAIDDAWTREWAAQRAVVYPVLPDNWLSGRGPAHHHGGHTRLLPLKNGGRGPALNVRGVLTVTSENNEHLHDLLPSTIAAGDLLNARLVPPCEAPAAWSRAHGLITYQDLAGGAWEQCFDFKKGPQGELELSLQEPTHTPLAARASAKE